MNKQNVEFVHRGMAEVLRLALEDRLANHEIAEMTLARENLERWKRKHIGRLVFAAKLSIETLHLRPIDESHVDAERWFGRPRWITGAFPEIRIR
jgi:hypothetical protein